MLCEECQRSVQCPEFSLPALTIDHTARRGEPGGVERERCGEHYTPTLAEFQSAEDAEEFGEDYDPPYPAVNVMIEVFDKIAVAFFTLEYIIRFACCPRKLKFFFRLLQPSPLRAI